MTLSVAFEFAFWATQSSPCMNARSLQNGDRSSRLSD